MSDIKISKDYQIDTTNDKCIMTNEYVNYAKNSTFFSVFPHDTTEYRNKGIISNFTWKLSELINFCFQRVSDISMLKNMSQFYSIFLNFMCNFEISRW